MTSKKTPSRSIDVAKLAGVSRSAVSRAFTKGAYVSPETRAKVLDAAAMLNYSPNIIARSLTMQRTNIVGVVITDLHTNEFYAQLLQELSVRLQAAGFGTLLIVTGREDSDIGIAQLLGYQVDAVILAAVMLSSTMSGRFHQWGKPVVLVDRYIESDAITSVSGDNAAGAASVADLMIDEGRQRIAFISGYLDTSSARDRERGFLGRLAARGQAPYAIKNGDYTSEGAAAATRQLLAMSPPPDAIFCANDLMAVAALEVARSEFGLSIPADIAIAGYNNSASSASSAYSLTTVDQNVAIMAEMAVSAAIARIADPSLPNERQLVSTKLVQRSTTGSV